MKVRVLQIFEKTNRRGFLHIWTPFDMQSLDYIEYSLERKLISGLNQPAHMSGKFPQRSVVGQRWFVFPLG